jgi:hypothetical protein
MDEHLQRLDGIAEQVAKGNERGFGCLSGGERAYVALAANSQKLLDEENYTMVQAFIRIDKEWRDHLISTWRYVDPYFFKPQ